MSNNQKNIWENRLIGITGASGTLGNQLSKAFRAKGANVIGITHNDPPNKSEQEEGSPNKWVKWNCGKEKELENILEKLDLLVLNHHVILLGT